MTMPLIEVGLALQVMFGFCGVFQATRAMLRPGLALSLVILGYRYYVGDVELLFLQCICVASFLIMFALHKDELQ